MEWNEISTLVLIVKGLYYLQEVCPIHTASHIRCCSVCDKLKYVGHVQGLTLLYECITDNIVSIGFLFPQTVQAVAEIL